jgi:flagellar biosynthesis/type III secretory pathway M-ring protein FliF/YscJ
MKKKKVFILMNVLLVLVFVGGVAVFLWREYAQEKVEYVDLYTNISPNEVGQISSKLEEWKQPYRLEEETTIKVPIADRDRLRLRLASEGLAPTGGIGYVVFDRTMFVMTDLERKKHCLDVLQEELERTIESIEQIEDAELSIYDPELLIIYDPKLFQLLRLLQKKKVYLEDEKPITASIKLELKPHARLTPGQIRGVVSLTASAVEGLASENVSVTVLNEEARRLERKIREKLGKVLGPDKLEVIVRCGMNFDTTLSKISEVVSVGVFIDGIYEYDAKGNLRRDKEGNPIYYSRSQEEMAKYEELVWAAIGELRKGRNIMVRIL